MPEKKQKNMLLLTNFLKASKALINLTNHLSKGDLDLGHEMCTYHGP